MTRRTSVAVLLVLIVTLVGCGREEYGRAAKELAEKTATSETLSAVRQVYPNLPSDVVFGNDQVIVQRVTAEPGIWAGEHSHTGDQLAVVLAGTELTYREAGQESPVTYQDGEVYWVAKTAAHDHAATGDTPWDGFVITLK